MVKNTVSAVLEWYEIAYDTLGKFTKQEVSELAQEEYEARIAELEEQVVKLTSENQELEETVQWMHDLIWEILGRRWNLHSVKEQSDAENSTKK